MHRAVLVVVLIVGCNQAFGLEPTITIDAREPPDFDKDGVADEIDDCPTLANTEQENADGDAFGDACDTCPQLASSSAHDEDRDGAGDDCDICPGVADFGDDSDMDRVGDLCDPTPGVQGSSSHRAVFEPFAAMPADWQAGAEAWLQSDDAIAPGALLGAGDGGLRHTTISTAGIWRSVAGFESRSRWQPSDRFGIIAKSASHEIRCVVTCGNAFTCSGAITIDGAIVVTYALTPRPYTTIAAIADANGLGGCAFDSNSGVTSVPTAGMTISLLATPRVRVAYFEHIQ